MGLEKNSLKKLKHLSKAIIKKNSKNYMENVYSPIAIPNPSTIKATPIIIATYIGLTNA